MKKMLLVVGATFALMVFNNLQSPAEMTPVISAAHLSTGAKVALLSPVASGPEGGAFADAIKKAHSRFRDATLPQPGPAMWGLMLGGLAVLLWRLRLREMTPLTSAR